LEIILKMLYMWVFINYIEDKNLSTTAYVYNRYLVGPYTYDNGDYNNRTWLETQLLFLYWKCIVSHYFSNNVILIDSLKPLKHINTFLFAVCFISILETLYSI
jgi:hypothetical protein